MNTHHSKTKLRYASNRCVLLSLFHMLLGVPSEFNNNYSMRNLGLHSEDFNIKAAWTFTSSGHGKSSCDGIGIAAKSAARGYSLRQDPEADFYTAIYLSIHTWKGKSNVVSGAMYTLS